MQGHLLSIHARIILALALLLGGAPAGAAVNFTQIAHSDDAQFADLRRSVPAFGQFGFAAPALNSQGDISFLAGAIDGSSGDVALYTGKGSQGPTLRLSSDGNGDDPSNPFSSLAPSAVPIDFSGSVAFGATLKGGGNGIFRLDAAAGAPTVIATDRTVQPGSPFAAGLYDNLQLRPSMNDNGEVVFAGVYGNGAVAGVFRGADPLATRVVDTTQSTRQASFWLDPVIAGGGVVGAMSENFDPAGPSFFNEVIGIGPGPLLERMLASTGDGTIAALQPPTVDINVHQQAVFQGLLDGLSGVTPSQQLLVAQGAGPAHSVADAKFGTTGQFAFKSFDGEAAITGTGLVAFTAHSAFGQKQLLAHQLGRSTASQGPVYAEVLRTGMLLDGRSLRDFSFTREGVNDRGEFAFVAEFADGTSAVYKANFGSTAPGVVPQPALRAETSTRRYDFATNTQTVMQDVDTDTVPGHAVSVLVSNGVEDALADALDDATGSHLKAVSRASSNVTSFTRGSVTESRAQTSVITNWMVPNPGTGATQETIRMLLTTDGSLVHEIQAPGPFVFAVGTGRLSNPGGVGIYAVAGTLLPQVSLVAEVNLTVNANVGGYSFNAFGGYASLRNGELIVGGDWDANDWTVSGDATTLRADAVAFQLVEYTVNYDETFALEFVIETLADSNAFFGNGTAIADFGNTARYSLSTASGARVLQLGSDGVAVVPLPAAAWLFVPGLGVLLKCRRRRS